MYIVQPSDKILQMQFVSDMARHDTTFKILSYAGSCMIFPFTIFNRF